MNIKLVKLVTNEEIICELVEREDSVNVVFKNPIVMMAVPNEDGQMGLGLAPWIPAGITKEIPIKAEHIVCIVEPSKDLYDHYNQTYGSGIITPDKQGVIEI